jgi:hypothetical protein
VAVARVFAGVDYAVNAAGVATSLVVVWARAFMEFSDR